MWDLPGPGLEPVSPALAGGFLTTAPPGKSQVTFHYWKSRPITNFNLILNINLIPPLSTGWHRKTKRLAGRDVICTQNLLPHLFSISRSTSSLVLGAGKEGRIFWHKWLLVSWGDVSLVLLRLDSWCWRAEGVCMDFWCGGRYYPGAHPSWGGAAPWVGYCLLWPGNPLSSILTSDHLF